ncbi:MAG: porin [Pseudomonadales bacterium]|jgi:phosphate-selective porin OprO/OprP|nr:porin [Pseudomonadales bacterium]
MYRVLLTATVAALLLTAPVAPARAGEIRASLDDGLEYRVAKRRHLRLGGRLHADSTFVEDDVTPIDDASELRRFRAILRGRFDDWRLRADYDFGLIEGWRGLYVQYRGLRRTRITLGQQVAPFSLDDLMSSNDLTFLERSLGSALSPGMLPGVSYQTWGDRWNATVGVFGNELNDQDRRQGDGTSYIGRFVYTPVRSRDAVLHLGIAQELRTIDGGSDVRLRTRPESRLADARLLSTPRLSGVDDLSTTGLEFMAIRRNLRLQSEYLRTALEGDGFDTAFTGGYVQLSAVLTGERYRYSGSGAYATAPRPRSRTGAIEAALRYSTLDLEEDGITGGVQEQVTGSLSWYVNRQLRITANYSRFETDPNSSGIDEQGSIVSLRFQATL